MNTGLRGRRALVTAASKGLGFATAKALVDEGCLVAVSSSDEARIHDAATVLRTNGGQVFAKSADLRQADDCIRLVDWANEELGGLDVW